MELWTRKPSEWHKQAINGCSRRILETVALRAMWMIEALPKRLQREARVFKRNCASDHSFSILANNLAAFFPCSDNVSEAKLKINGLISLVE